MSRRLIFTIPSYSYLEASFMAAGEFEHGELERKNFPDGERYLRIMSDLFGREVVLLGGTPTGSTSSISPAASRAVERSRSPS